MSITKVLEQMTDKPFRNEHVDIYTDADPVNRLDDGSFLYSKKIRSHAWQGPGVLKVYAPWCPHCQQKVEAINILAASTGAVYVLDGTVNPSFRFATGINSYPTFLKVLPDGTLGEEIDGDLDAVVDYLNSLGA
jgi:thiol-disulfide isomerase/thioredoxin